MSCAKDGFRKKIVNSHAEWCFRLRQDNLTKSTIIPKSELLRLLWVMAVRSLARQAEKRDSSSHKATTTNQNHIYQMSSNAI